MSVIGSDERQPGDDPEARHRARMQRRKAVVDARIAAATEQRGVLLVLTGNGKGKSSSAFGMVAHAHAMAECAGYHAKSGRALSLAIPSEDQQHTALLGHGM